MTTTAGGTWRPAVGLPPALTLGPALGLLLVVAPAAGCAGSSTRSRSWPPPMPAPMVVPVVQAPQEPRQLRDYGPDVLLPDPAAADAEVARVGDLVLRQSHAFGRLMSADPKLALSAVDLLVFDVLVAQHARQFDVRVEPERVRALTDQEEQQLREQVTAELGGQVTFPQYVWRIFGMRLDDWRRAAELRVAQRLYQGYVIRYLALREDRVRVRYIVHEDRGVLEEAAISVRQGADFGTLALRLSSDALRRDGGLLPPFGEGFPHPVTEQALKLEVGDLSPVFEHTANDTTQYYLVYCLERLAGREVPFAEVRDEIDKGLVDKPLSPIETNAYTLRWRAASEAKTDDKPAPPR